METMANNIHGIQVARKTPNSSDVFFVCECLPFSNENYQETDTIMNVLAQYQDASGHMVSLEKTEVYFSQNVSESIVEMICNRMGVNICSISLEVRGFTSPS